MTEEHRHRFAATRVWLDGFTVSVDAPASTGTFRRRQLQRRRGDGERTRLAADPITVDISRGQQPGRLVLIDAMELSWQRAKYLGNQHLLLPADPGLVGLNTLQLWLWQRLQAPTPSQVAA